MNDLPFPDEDRGLQLIAGYWTMCAIAMVVVTLRIWSRISIRGVASDDYVMLFTLALFVFLTATIQVYAAFGGCRHLIFLTPEEQRRAIKWNWIVQPAGIFGFATGKLSVGLLILRVMGRQHPWKRWTIWIAVGSTLIFNSLNCIFSFAQCNPPRALWDRELLATGQAKCWDPSIQKNFGVFMSSWNVLTDVILSVIPVTIFWNLQMPLKQKIALCCLLGLSLVAAISGSIKIKFLTGLTARSDLTWETYNLFIWSGAELFVIIVCGSIPPIKPLYDRFYKKATGITSKQGSGTSEASSKLTPQEEIPFNDFQKIESSNDEVDSSWRYQQQQKFPALRMQDNSSFSNLVENDVERQDVYAKGT